MGIINPTWESDCGTVKLWLGDCLEIMQSWPNGAVDAVVTDPPYGIGYAAEKNRSRGDLAVARDYGNSTWDDRTQPERVMLAIDKSRQAIVFGGNYYDLPPSSCWLVWDKMNRESNFADCELAWTNLRRAVRMISFRWNGFIRDGRDSRGLHPTQKPESVMRWAMSFTSGMTIADPFMGSGTTGVAAVSLDRQFWGIELDPKYFETAKRRIQDELRKIEFLEPQRVKEQRKQAVLFGSEEVTA